MYEYYIYYEYNSLSYYMLLYGKYVEVSETAYNVCFSTIDWIYVVML